MTNNSVGRPSFKRRVLVLKIMMTVDVLFKAEVFQAFTTVSVLKNIRSTFRERCPRPQWKLENIIRHKKVKLEESRLHLSKKPKKDIVVQNQISRAKPNKSQTSLLRYPNSNEDSQFWPL